MTCDADYSVLLIIILACCSHDLMIISSFMHLLRRRIHVQLTHHFFSTFVITSLDNNIQQSRRIYASPLLCDSYFMVFPNHLVSVKSTVYFIYLYIQIERVWLCHHCRHPHYYPHYFFHVKIWTYCVKWSNHIKNLKVFILQSQPPSLLNRPIVVIRLCHLMLNISPSI